MTKPDEPLDPDEPADEDTGPEAPEVDATGKPAMGPDVDVQEPTSFRVVEPDEVEIVESQKEREVRQKEQAAPPRPKSQMGVLLAMFAVLFIMIDPNLRTLTGNIVGVALDPMIAMDGRFPVLTIILAGAIMITLSSLVRHFFIDWIKMARTQNTMRAFQKEFSEARRSRDQKRINELTKAQQGLMGLQAEMSSGQMKPMAVTMLVVIPMFAWLWNFVSHVDYHYFSAPWNLKVHMFTTEGIVFGSSILPHWILLYSVLSIPFGQLLQKGLKVWSWRKRVDHVLSDHPDVHDERA